VSEDARIDHPGEALQVMRRRLRRAKTVACAYPVVIDSSKEEEEKEDASIYDVSPHILK
jgi:hypothetical protein